MPKREKMHCRTNLGEQALPLFLLVVGQPLERGRVLRVLVRVVEVGVLVLKLLQAKWRVEAER
jgi:hypothetical protein